jgi:hypothetical protein
MSHETDGSGTTIVPLKLSTAAVSDMTKKPGKSWEARKRGMSLFLLCSHFDRFEIFRKFRQVGKIIDPAAQPTDRTVIAHARRSPPQAISK